MAMKMYTQAFNKMMDVDDFVNERGISQDRIVSIFQTIDGTFLLIYYGE